MIACTFFGAGGMLGHDQLITVGVLQNSVLIVTEIKTIKAHSFLTASGSTCATVFPMLEPPSMAGQSKSTPSQ